MFRNFALALLIFATCLSTNAQAQSWATGLFKETKHDFGVVARAAKTKHIFEFTNTTGSTIYLSAVRTSCNCTIPRILTYSVEPGKVGQIEAEYNTRAFKGQKGANVTVTFSSPQFAEVQLRIDGYIRGDIVFSPGEVSFGNIIAGDSNERSVKLMYAGKADWQILEIQSPHPGMTAVAKETRREGLYTDYEITVNLDKTVPLGFINKQLILVTNDGARKNIPLMVTGQLKAPIQVPAVVNVGNIKSGTTASKVVVAKGVRAFTVLDISSKDSRIKVAQPEDSKQIHLLKVNVSGDHEGEFTEDVIMKTDDPAMPEVPIRITGKVISDQK